MHPTPDTRRKYPELEKIEEKLVWYATKYNNYLSDSSISAGCCEVESAICISSSSSSSAYSSSTVTQETYEPWHKKTNKMSVRPAKDQPGHPESSLYAQRVAMDRRFLHADSVDSDQTGRMPRLIWVFAGRTVTLLVLSCRGSYEPRHEKTCLLRAATTVNSNRPAQLQKLTRVLKFWI